VYRDLKPENVLVFDDGHLKLTDFGLCKEGVDYTHRTSTFCGTQEYIAYEIFNHAEYDHTVDWWSFGVMIYEMFTFVTPFYHPDDAQIEENVLSKDAQYVETIPRRAKRIIQALLEREPHKRLGHINSPHGLLKNHEFYSEPYTLENINNRRVKPPWIPRRDLALTSQTIKAMLSGPGQFAENETNEIHFRSITSHILAKICMYFAYKARYTNSTVEIPEFYIPPDIALELLMAANFLDC
ncbi:unnamed protein product, partial [Didymodactylos carnosus]